MRDVPLAQRVQGPEHDGVDMTGPVDQMRRLVPGPARTRREELFSGDD